MKTTHNGEVMKKQSISGVTFLVTCCTALLVGAASLFAQDVPPPSDHEVEYSPYPSKTFPNRVYFGDTHLHTSYSTDAGMTGTTIGPDEAYRLHAGKR